MAGLIGVTPARLMLRMSHLRGAAHICQGKPPSGTLKRGQNVRLVAKPPILTRPPDYKLLFGKSMAISCASPDEVSEAQALPTTAV